MPPRLSYSVARLREICRAANLVPWERSVLPADRTLAQTARIAVPELCDAVEELQAQVDALTAELVRVRGDRATLEFPAKPKVPA